MDINELFEQNKNNIINLSIVILALFIAFQIYSQISEKTNLLTQQKDNELKKNEASSEIAAFEKKIEDYKKVFVKRELGAVMDTVSSIARECAVRVVSIKPEKEETAADYIKSSFAVTINAPDYHALGDFISRIENYKDIYFVDEIRIDSSGFDRASEGPGEKLKVSLKISIISYL